jgi:hypothetical protein
MRRDIRYERMTHLSLLLELRRDAVELLEERQQQARQLRRPVGRVRNLLACERVGP